MDEQKPIWRTAWYWKRVGLYLLAPLCVACGTLALLRARHDLTPHECDRIVTLLSALSPVAFSIWIHLQARKQSRIANP